MEWLEASARGGSCISNTSRRNASPDSLLYQVPNERHLCLSVQNPQVYTFWLWVLSSEKLNGSPRKLYQSRSFRLRSAWFKDFCTKQWLFLGATSFCCSSALSMWIFPLITTCLCRILDPELPQEQFQTLSNEPNSRESQYMIASRQLAAALSNFELDTDSESETDEELAQLLSKVHNPNLHTDQNLHPAELQPTDDRGQETGIVPDVKCSEATSLHLPIDCPLQEESQHQLSVNDLQSHANSIENRTARSQDARQDSSTKQRNLEEQFSDTEVYSSLCRVDPAIDDEHGSDIVQHKNVSAALQEQQISQKALTAIWSLLEAFIIDAPVTSTFPQHCAGDDGVYKEEKVSRPQPSMKRGDLLL